MYQLPGTPPPPRPRTLSQSYPGPRRLCQPGSSGLFSPTDLSFVPSQDRTNQPALVCQNNEFGNSFSLYPTTTAEDFSIAIEYARAFGVCWRTSGASLLRVKSAQTFDDDDLANASFSSCLLCSTRDLSPVEVWDRRGEGPGNDKVRQLICRLSFATSNSGLIGLPSARRPRWPRERWDLC